VTAGLFALLFAGCAAMLSGLNNLNFDVQVARKRLAPIPVSPKVCPYVRVMHSAANDFQRVNPMAIFFETNPAFPTKAAWPAQRARLQQSLNVLEFTVVASQAHFPAPIRKRFHVVLVNIREGRSDIRAMGSEFDPFTGSTSQDLSAGQAAFGDASDLIGNACGVHLAADPL
jgi:hypothetical protein